MMKILITGDSHTAALQRGLKALRAQGALREGVEVSVKPLGGGHVLPTPFWRDAGDHAEIIAPGYRAQFTRLPPQQPAIDVLAPDVLALCMPLWPMRILHRMAGEKLALADRVADHATVSKAVFRQLVLADQQHVLGLIDLFNRIRMPCVALSPPVLFADHKVLARYPAAQALRVFDTYRAIMLAELAARDVPVIDLPPETRQADGFMRPDFRHDDPEDAHHANAAFGALMIRRLQDWAQDRAQDRASSTVRPA